MRFTTIFLVSMILVVLFSQSLAAPAAEPEAMAEPHPDPEAKPIIGLLVDAVKKIFGK